MPTACPHTPASVTSLYEREELQRLAGGILRPGGIELTAEMLHACRPAPGAAGLDVGCGLGHTVALMRAAFGLRAAGLDPSLSMLAQAVQNAPGASFILGEATAIPCISASYALIIAECVLSLTSDLDASLTELHRVLEPEGLLLISDLYCRTEQISPKLPGLHSCISQALPLASIENALKNAGFSLCCLVDRSDKLKQLAGQIIFSHGSLEKFWQLFMGPEAARATCCTLAAVPLGYYALIARKGG